MRAHNGLLQFTLFRHYDYACACRLGFYWLILYTTILSPNKMPCCWVWSIPLTYLTYLFLFFFALLSAKKHVLTLHYPS